MIVYMIHDLRTGLYSKGGIPPEWGKKESAKIWTKRGSVVKHILLLARHNKGDGTFQDFLSQVYVESFELSVPREMIPIGDLPLDPLPQSKKKREEYEAGPKKTLRGGSA